MKRLIILMLVQSLTGCVGITLSKNGNIVERPDLSAVPLKYRKAPPSNKAGKINADGTKSYVVEDEAEWCGLTIWIIVPIPLQLPVCSNRTEVTYLNGKPTKSSTQWVKKYFAGCSPIGTILQLDHLASYGTTDEKYSTCGVGSE